MIGREFAHEQLAAVSSFSEGQLSVALDQLVESGLIFRRGTPLDATYPSSTHWSKTYQSLLRTTRRHYHAQIARLFEQRFPEIAETQPEFVAHHYTEAADPEQALRYWHQAGRHAGRRSANAETIGHLTRGLEISRLPTVSAHT